MADSQVIIQKRLRGHWSRRSFKLRRAVEAATTTKVVAERALAESQAARELVLTLEAEMERIWKEVVLFSSLGPAAFFSYGI